MTKGEEKGREGGREDIVFSYGRERKREREAFVIIANRRSSFLLSLFEITKWKSLTDARDNARYREKRKKKKKEHKKRI